MKITLERSSYSGADGSSLTNVRCEQIVHIYDMLVGVGNKTITYKGLQHLADEHKIFGDSKADSAIRTFFPLLKKLNFVNYNGEFLANECFTELGELFVIVCRSQLEIKKDVVIHNDEIEAKLQAIKEDIQKEGLICMLNNSDLNNRSIKVALKLFSIFKTINWNEFLYVLYKLSKGKKIEEAINDIQKDKAAIDKIEFVNESGKPLPTTCYSYIRSLLIESGIITDIGGNDSRLTTDGIQFLSYLNL